MLHNPPKRKSLALTFSRQELALIAVTVIWGGTFLIVQQAMTVSGALFFVGLRFLIAGLLGALVFRRDMVGLTRTEVSAGVMIGLMLCLGYALQGHGLKTITTSQSAFITALYVPIVPLLQWGLLRRPPGLMSWLGIGLAFAGLVLLAGPDAGQVSFSSGELLTLGSAVAVAAEIILISMYAGRVNSRRITVMQLLAGSGFCFLLMPVAGESLPAFHWIWVTAAIGLGAASALIQLTMNWAQKVVSPTRATVIYTGEPVFAGIFGRIAGERLPALAMIGALLILIGVIVSELKPAKATSKAAGKASATTPS
ncbi:DMT family transporter [Paracoccus aminophilus]|uniref:EamA domain-containing protein n=1 Tax=Paracoccus aminophilus JCM 7686 TaxID=1367847 RepID=S5XM07_PARAH|nr:DMT family transporter [Paracoccus aminophilus]AGT08304.1 hypothetical protein JCM7686_1195 [Paracoccus aminophilus JCM 7686]